jgi:hypothetical protein
MRQEMGFKFCLDTRNNETHPLDLAWPRRLIVQSLANLPYCHPLSLYFH